MSSRYSSSSSKYSRGTRYDRKKHKEDVQKQEEEQERPSWTPQPSPPGSWAAIVAAAATKEPDGETLPSDDE